MQHSRFSPPNGPLLVTVLAWAYNFTAVKFVYREIEPAAVALTRCIVVGLFLVGVCWSLKLSLKVPRELWARVILQGFLANGLYMVLFMDGMGRTTPAMGAVILATAPVLTATFSMLVRHEPFHRGVLVGGAIAFAGVFVAVQSHGGAMGGTLLGNAMILGAAIVWSCSILLMQRILGAMTPLQAVTCSTPGALLALVPYGLMATLKAPWSQVSAVGWGNYIHVALISGGLAFITYYKGTHMIGVVRATTYQFLVPPVAALMAWVALGQKPQLIFWLGLGLVVVGVAVVARAKGSLRPREVKPQI